MKCDSKFIFCADLTHKAVAHSSVGLPWGRIFPNRVHQKSVKRSDHKGSRDSKVYFILKFCHYTLIHRINRVAIQTLALQPAARRLISNFGIDFVGVHTHTNLL